MRSFGKPVRQLLDALSNKLDELKTQIVALPSTAQLQLNDLTNEEAEKNAKLTQVVKEAQVLQGTIAPIQ